MRRPRPHPRPRAVSEPWLHGEPTEVAGVAPPPLVAGDERPRRGGLGVVAGLIGIVTLGALAHVGVRLKGLEVAYALGQERRLANDLEEQRRRLQIEIGMLKDPGRVSAIARGRLNMSPPSSEAIRRLEGERGAGVLPATVRTTEPAPAPRAKAKPAPVRRRR